MGRFVVGICVILNRLRILIQAILDYSGSLIRILASTMSALGLCKIARRPGGQKCVRLPDPVDSGLKCETGPIFLGYDLRH
jgi:hypothetical protein